MKLSLFMLFCALLCGADKKGTTETFTNEKFRISISTKRQGNFEPGAMKDLAMIYLKVENLSGDPLQFDLTTAYLKTEDGKSLRRITPEEATGIIQRLPMMRVLTKMADMDNPALIASGPKSKELAPPVPPKSWREGLIYFEGTGDAGKQKRPVLLFFPPLLTEGVPVNW